MQDTKNTTQTKSAAKEVLDFFSSVQTAIVVLFLIAAASVIGTVVPQDKTIDQLAGSMSPLAFKLTAILDLHRLFSSWWFLLLLIILALQLLACLYSRWPKIASDFRRDSKKTSFRLELESQDPKDPVESRVKDALSRIMGRSPHKVDSTDNPATYRWIKHRTQELGFPMAHLAIILIMLGGLVGMIYGFKGHISILEGKSGSVVRLFPDGAALELPFEIHLDKFTLKRYESGAPKEFRSDLRLIRDGETVDDSYLLVNHPITYEGISLYQSSYNVRGVDKIRLEVNKPGGDKVVIEASPDEPVIIPGADIKLNLMSLAPDSESGGAALTALVEEPGADPHRATLVENARDSLEIGDHEIKFLGYTPLYSSGIQVSYDPGTPLVWLGCGLLILGFGLTLFTNHRRIFLLVEENEGNGSNIRISGRSKRARKEFREAVTQAAKEAIEGNDRTGKDGISA